MLKTEFFIYSIRAMFAESNRNEMNDEALARSPRGKKKGVSHAESLATATPEFKEIHGICRQLGCTMAEMAQQADVPLGTIYGWKKRFTGSYEAVAKLDRIRALIVAKP